MFWSVRSVDLKCHFESLLSSAALLIARLNEDNPSGPCCSVTFHWLSTDNKFSVTDRSAGRFVEDLSLYFWGLESLEEAHLFPGRTRLQHSVVLKLGRGVTF